MTSRNTRRYTIEGPLQSPETEEATNVPRGIRKGVASAGTVIALAVGVPMALHASEPKEAGPNMPYMVEPGDTEWSLAARVAPNKDPREVADEIDHRLPNDAAHKDHMLQPGDVITYEDGHITGYHSPSEGN